jgi:hypothetical protein
MKTVQYQSAFFSYITENVENQRQKRSKHEVEPSTKTFSVHPSTVEEKATEETQIDATTTELKGLTTGNLDSFHLLNTTETTSTTNAPTGLLTFAESAKETKDAVAHCTLTEDLLIILSR